MVAKTMSPSTHTAQHVVAAIDDDLFRGIQADAAVVEVALGRLEANDAGIARQPRGVLTTRRCNWRLAAQPASHNIPAREHNSAYQGCDEGLESVSLDV